MTIHEFGNKGKPTVVLVHPSMTRWDYFEYVIPLLKEQYHLIVPALPGYDPDAKGDYTSVEEIAKELENWIIYSGCANVACLYGCSMGGSVVLRMIADGRLSIQNAVIDGGITPYQFPRLVTRCIAVRDFLMIYLGKMGGMRLLTKAFAADEYSADDLQYIADVLHHMSAKTVWRTFDSCNNYAMPEQIDIGDTTLEYWVAEKEVKARELDLQYMQSHFPRCKFRRFRDIGHGGLAVTQPEKFARGIRFLCEKGA